MDLNALSKWCRMCFNEFINGVFLFGQESSKMLIRVKIKKYLGFEISLDDNLSKMICEDCCKMLDGFHRFATMASNNQEKMKKFLHPSGVQNNKKDYKVNGDKSLLHSYLTKTFVSEKTVFKDNLLLPSDSEVTEMEVRLDPMVILEYGSHEENGYDSGNGMCQSNASSESETEDYPDSNRADENTYFDIEPACLIMENSQCPSNEDADSKEMSSEDEEDGDECQNDVFNCKICGKNMSTKGNLKVHLATHWPKGKYECDICRRIFKTQCNLHRHKEYHGGVQYPCVVCGRVYPTNSTLRAHSITHSDLRPHKCPLCEKTFKRNQDLKFHINQHTGARPYRCPYCPKAFASSGNCFSHRKRMHALEVERDRGNAVKNIR